MKSKINVTISKLYVATTSPHRSKKKNDGFKSKKIETSPFGFRVFGENQNSMPLLA